MPNCQSQAFRMRSGKLKDNVIVLYMEWNVVVEIRTVSTRKTAIKNLATEKIFTFFCMHALKMIDNKLISAKGFMMLSFCWVVSYFVPVCLIVAVSCTSNHWSVSFLCLTSVQLVISLISIYSLCFALVTFQILLCSCLVQLKPGNKGVLLFRQRDITSVDILSGLKRLKRKIKYLLAHVCFHAHIFIM